MSWLQNLIKPAPSTKFTIGTLNSLYTQLSRTTTVTERNKATVVENLSLIHI